MVEENELSGGTTQVRLTCTAAGTGSGTGTEHPATADTDENEAWDEWQQDILNDEDSDHTEDLDSDSGAARTVSSRTRNTRSVPKQKIRIATFFNKHTQSNNKRKRALTLEDISGDSPEDTDDDREDGTSQGQSRQRPHSREVKTGNHRKMNKKKRE